MRRMDGLDDLDGMLTVATIVGDAIVIGEEGHAVVAWDELGIFLNEVCEMVIRIISSGVNDRQNSTFHGIPERCNSLSVLGKRDGESLHRISGRSR